MEGRDTGTRETANKDPKTAVLELYRLKVGQGQTKVTMQ